MLNSLNLGFQNPENAKKDVRTETNSDAFFYVVSRRPQHYNNTNTTIHTLSISDKIFPLKRIFQNFKIFRSGRLEKYRRQARILTDIKRCKI